MCVCREEGHSVLKGIYEVARHMRRRLSGTVSTTACASLFHLCTVFCSMLLVASKDYGEPAAGVKSGL